MLIIRSEQITIHSLNPLCFSYLHDPNDGAAIPREVAQASDDIGGVQEGLAISREPREEAHDGHGRRAYKAHDGGPDKKVAREELNRAGSEDHPGPRKRGPFGLGRRAREGGAMGVGNDGGVEEARQDAEVSADVLENRDGVEGGLVVALRRFQHGGVNAKGVGCAAARLDPDGGGDRRPRIRHPPHRSLGGVMG